MKRTDLKDKYLSLRTDVPYITVATTCDDGSPWNTPVAGFHFDDDDSLYWASWRNNQHSRNLRRTKKAFIVIYDSTPADGRPKQGLYIQAGVSEISSKNEVIEAAKVFGDDPYNPSDGKEYLASKPRRIYKAVPEKIWINEDAQIDGNFIDVRKLIFEKT